MLALTLADLDARSAELDAAVLACDDIDHFCSSSDWLLPAAEALMPRRETFVHQCEYGWMTLMRAQQPVGDVLEPLEAMWALGCPLVTTAPQLLARELVDECARTAPRALLFLSGFVRSSRRFVETVRTLDRRYALRLGPSTRRHCADLRDGVDGWLSRRSANVRRGLVRAQRRARDEGIEIVPVEVPANHADRVYERLLAVERKSWKAHEGVSILHSEMLGFYRLMLRRLAKRRAARLMFARRDGEDVAYILGGLFGHTYRGLQFSFDRQLEQLSLGNLCQLEQVRALCEEGIEVYDLGAEVEYKRRWGELVRETVSIFALPR